MISFTCISNLANATEVTFEIYSFKKTYKFTV